MNENLWNRKNSVVVTCPRGLAPYLADELKALCLPVLTAWESGVETEATLADTLMMNLSLRTGHRVLYLLEEGEARNPAQCYGLIARLSWESWVADDGYLCVTSAVDTPVINDPRFVNVTVKDAIVDRIRERMGKRPDSGPERTGTVVHVYWQGDRIRVFFDTSGEPLSRRGYRRIPLQAPMQETLAAGGVIATGWLNDGPFVNPMCGSGTLAIEAALMALNRKPGILRSNFGFMHILGFDSREWEDLCQKARSLERNAAAFPMVATDIRGEAVRASRQNAREAGVEDLISFHLCPFEKTPVPQGSGVVLLNPGYGERLGTEKELASVYGRIGDFFKQTCQGYRASSLRERRPCKEDRSQNLSEGAFFSTARSSVGFWPTTCIEAAGKVAWRWGGERCLMNVPTLSGFSIQRRRFDRRTSPHGTVALRKHHLFR